MWGTGEATEEACRQTLTVCWYQDQQRDGRQEPPSPPGAHPWSLHGSFVQAELPQVICCTRVSQPSV